MNEIILKYLNKEMNIDDQHRLSKWLDEDPKNRKVLNKVELYWKSADSSAQIAKNRIWIKLIDEIDSSPELGDQIEVKNIHIKWYRVAAAVALLVASSFVAYNFWFSNNPNNSGSMSIIEKVSPLGKKLELQLTDGTMVKLNSGSKISYPETFEGNSREVVLTGEAFFDVARDESKPFIISSKNIHVEVLGTSFSVQAYEDEAFSEVFVKSGKVRVSDALGRSFVDILPAEKATYSKEDKVLMRSDIQNSSVAFGWMDGRLVFEDEVLEVVFKRLSRWYGVSISYDKITLKNKRITANCKACSIHEMMESLSYNYEFDYEISGDLITIN
ncbi:MAG: FecR domain-containing protein [Cyclobacteriaceae bacterium]